ncbi:unnamed protein product [Amoebophrya sp. A25]|nr:unnamed protein product [Amoebophrya sp. A25]|eukprot:GSA25T00002065001.1
MNFHQVRSRLRTSYITDPYSLLIHYKRAYKLLKLVKENAGRVLILGNRNHFGVNWQQSLGFRASGDGSNAPQHSMHTRVDEHVISTASKDYSLVLCLDPILFAKALHRINLPVMMIATPKELHEHPEILQVTDYLLPATTSKHDAALSELLRRQIVGAPNT